MLCLLKRQTTHDKQVRQNSAVKTKTTHISQPTYDIMTSDTRQKKNHGTVLSHEHLPSVCGTSGICLSKRVTHTVRSSHHSTQNDWHTSAGTERTPPHPITSTCQIDTRLVSLQKIRDQLFDLSQACANVGRLTEEEDLRLPREDVTTSGLNKRQQPQTHTTMPFSTKSTHDTKEVTQREHVNRKGTTRRTWDGDVEFAKDLSSGQ